MDYLNAFLCGGILCAVGQILIDKTPLTPARILTGYVVAGVLLTAVGIYEPIVEWGGAGATVPLTGFGYSLASGVKKAVAEQGWLGVMTGGLSATAGGIAAAGAESRTVTVGVRPVHVTVGDEGIDAQIDVSELMGSELHLHMTADGKDVVAVVQTANLDANAYARHTAVRFSFEPRLIHLFDPETEKNLI